MQPEGACFPRGYADFALQLLIWFGFLPPTRSPAAWPTATRRAPSRTAGASSTSSSGSTGLGELTLQGWTQSSHFLETLVSWTYWNSEFTVIGLALLWVYFRRNEAFTRFRNTILLANVLGLIGYVLLPTAPPRLFTSIGFTDTLASSAASTTAAGSSSSPRTRTRRCRACTPPTR